MDKMTKVNRSKFLFRKPEEDYEMESFSKLQEGQTKTSLKTQANYSFQKQMSRDKSSDLKAQYAIMNNRTNEKRAKIREHIVFETFKAVETKKLVEDLKYEPWNLPPGL